MEMRDKIQGLRRTLSITNLSLLSVHSLLLAFFLIQGITFMGAFNVLSVACYIIGIILIQKEKLLAYIIMALAEVLLHLAAATLSVGWDAGFPLYALPISFIAFCLRYFFADKRYLGKLPEVASALSAAVFIALRILMQFRAPAYGLKESLCDIIYLINCTVIFGFIAMCMHAYTALVMDRETNLHERADFDELTQVFNRHKMRDVLDRTNASGGLYSTTILDIDDFKKVNDTYGHDAGDYVLRTATEIMKQQKAVGTEVSIGRWGGEEFLIVQLHPDGQDADRAADVEFIEAILSAVRGYSFLYRGTEFSVTMTAGIAWHEAGEPIAATINRADSLLYAGKESGKDRLVSASQRQDSSNAPV